VGPVKGTGCAIAAVSGDQVAHGSNRREQRYGAAGKMPVRKWHIDAPLFLFLNPCGPKTKTDHKQIIRPMVCAGCLDRRRCACQVTNRVTIGNYSRGSGEGETLG